MKNLILSASAFCLLVAVAPVAVNAADVSSDINASAAVTTPVPASLDAVPAAEPVMGAPAASEKTTVTTTETPATDVTASPAATSAAATAATTTTTTTTEATPAAIAEEAPKAVKKHVKRTKVHHKSKRTAAEIAADNEATARASGAAIAKVGQGVAGVGAAGVDVNAGVHADVSPAAH